MPIPEGTPCECGMYVISYENCPTCGNRISTMIPNNAHKGGEVGK